MNEAERQAACPDRGERLFETGHRPHWMHFVEEGEVILQRIGEDGGLVVLQRTRHGFIGEASLQSERYHCDALMVANASVVRVPQQALMDALRAHGTVALRWIGRSAVRAVRPHGRRTVSSVMAQQHSS
ncbi:MAG: cyclic nucleotide-binding domain-containing protein [Chitinophagaceae bacterium]|nr:cyclic nucleotide-binding domain-containing protein [Rubrivivax sp.]